MVKPSALVVTASFVALTFFACTMPQRPFEDATCSVGDTNFVNHVKILSNPFYFPASNGSYQPPADSGPVQSSVIRADLQGAFNLAPPQFRDRLCGLTKIFINPTGCAPMYSCSWGYRERPDQPPGTGEYIAISQVLWQGAEGHALPLSEFENILLQQLLGWDAAQYTSSDPYNTPEMAVLSALAHEYGHILWYDQNNPANRRRDDYNPDVFCQRNFFKQAWNNLDPVYLRPPIWRQFGNTQMEGGNPNVHLSGDAAIDKIISDAGMHNRRATTDDLRKIYKHPGRWFSLFAAFSPDEDFIETFKYYILLQPDGNDQPQKLKSLTINMPDQTTADVPADYADGQDRQELHAKMGCFKNLP